MDTKSKMQSRRRVAIPSGPNKTSGSEAKGKMQSRQRVTIPSGPNKTSGMDTKSKMQSRQRVTMPSGPNKTSGFASKISDGQCSAKTDTQFDDSEGEELLSDEEECDEEVPPYYLLCEKAYERVTFHLPDGSPDVDFKRRINNALFNMAKKKIADGCLKQLPDLSTEKTLPQKESELSVADDFVKQLADLSTENKNPQESESQESESEDEELSEDEEGFDLARLRRPSFQRILPLKVIAKNEELLGRLNYLSSLSIDKFNRKNEENYELVEVLSANFMPCAGRVYFITFRARKSDTDWKDFQARVFDGIKKEVEVNYCRPAVRNTHAQVLKGKRKEKLKNIFKEK